MATYGYLCGTPKQHCKGSQGSYSASLDKRGIKRHGSHVDAMKCYSAYLVNVLGCEKIGNREFRLPDNGGIMVLTKVSRFGTRLRKGKRGEGAGGSSRGMPDKRHGGVVISS